MSFGYSVSDSLAVGQLAWTVYKSCRDAPESFNNISTEVLSLHAVLKEVEEILSGQPLSESKKASLATIINGCRNVLQDLQALVQKFESLGSQTKRTWDRMRWGSKDIAGLRARLTANTVLLTAFMSTSQIVVEKKLNKLVQEFRDGKHEGSVMSVASVESLSLDDKQIWRTIRKELEDIGLSVAAFDTNKAFIMEWFQKALNSGAFQEQAPANVSRYHDMTIYGDARNIQVYQGTLQSPFLSEQGGMNTAELEEERRIDDAINENRPCPDSDISSDTQSLNDLGGHAQTVSEEPHLPPAATQIQAKGESRKTDTTSNRRIIRKPIPVPRDMRTPRIVLLFAWMIGYNKLFLTACRYDDVEGAQKLLNKGADVNAKNRYGYTGIHDAVFIGYESLLKMLLIHGANVELRDQMGHTPLQAAALAGNVNIVQILLKGGADIEAHSYGSYPLVLATIAGEEAVVRLLLEMGANIEAGDNSGTALHAAARTGNIAIVEYLLYQGANIEAMYGIYTPLLDALRNGRDDAAQVLIKRGADVTGSATTALHIAAQHSCGGALRLLLFRGADIEAFDQKGLTALDYAVTLKDPTIARCLLENGAVIHHNILPGDPTHLAVPETQLQHR